MPPECKLGPYRRLHVSSTPHVEWPFSKYLLSYFPFQFLEFLFFRRDRDFTENFHTSQKTMNFRLLPNKLYSNDKHCFLRGRRWCTQGEGLRPFSIYQYQFESTLANTWHIMSQWIHLTFTQGFLAALPLQIHFSIYWK